MRTFEGHVVGGDIRIGIVAARFNEFIVGKLVAGALDGLKRHEVDEDQIDIAWVPGAFEIPLICQKMVKSGKYDAIIALGAVIRGSTTHYDYVAARPTTTMSAAKFPRASPMWPLTPTSRSCSAS